MYDLAALERELVGTIFAGKLRYAATTDSTNTDAMKAARAGAPHGSVWVADEQTAGRGRADHVWHSAAGQGLYVSILLRTEIPASRRMLLPLAAGLAAAGAVRSVSGLHVDLRWPNDLLIGPRKAGGVLVEAMSQPGSPLRSGSLESRSFESASLQSGSVLRAVAGIGINVHQREFAPGLVTPATSLDLESGARISRQALLVALLKSLERETAALTDTGAADQIVSRVERASTWVRGRRVEVHGPQACSGITAGLDEHGFLRVETAAGPVTVQTGGIRALE